MKLKRFAITFGKYAVTSVLTIGVIIAFGVLSTSGLLLVTPSIGLAVCAFIFGGVVEGEVFKQEIFEGLNDIVMLGKRGYQYMIANALQKYLKQHPSQTGFLNEYQRLLKFLNALKGKRLTDAQKREKENARKRLRHMDEYLVGLVMNNNENIPEPYTDDNELRASVLAIRGEMPAIRRRMAMLRIAVPFSLLCGAGFGFATLSALPAALAMISASLSFLVWPLAVAAAIGYTFLIFHTAKEILFSDGFRKWKDRLIKWFTPGDDGVTAKFVLKTIAIALVAAATVALCVMGTLATAGTWWLAVKHGAKLVPYVKTAATIIRSILTPVAALGSFIFSIYNSFESIHVVKRAIESSRPVQHIKEQWHEIRQKENYAQIFNPFRIICKFTQKTTDAVFLLGHVLASGMARDQFMNIPPAALAVTTAGSELTQDITFFFEEGKKTLPQKIVMILMSPLLLLSAGWQCAASQCNTPENRVSFVNACKQSFGVVDKQSYAGDDQPPQSSSWRNVEIHRYFAVNAARLNRTVIHRDKAQAQLRKLEETRDELLQIEHTGAGSVANEYRSRLQGARFFEGVDTGNQNRCDDGKIDHSCSNVC